MEICFLHRYGLLESFIRNGPVMDDYHLFLNCPFLQRSARVRRFFRCEVSTHIPEHYPFRVQTQLIHIFLPLHAHLTPATTTFLQADTQSSSLLRSTCSNHLNLPHLIHALNLQKTVQIHSALPSFSDTSHIHLTNRSVLSRLWAAQPL